MSESGGFAIIGMGNPYQSDDVEDGAKKLERLLDQATDNHVWTSVIMFVLEDEPKGALVLDQHNLAAGPVVGCYRCERGYDPQVAAQPCPGEPVGD